MLAKLILAACLVGSIVALSSGQQNFNELNLDKLAGFLNTMADLEPITVKCDHLWIQMSIESRSYMLPRRGQRNQFEVERDDFKQLLDNIGQMNCNPNARNFLASTMQQCLGAFERYDREIGIDNKPFNYSMDNIYDMNAMIKYFNHMDTPAQCSHFWMGAHVILFRMRPRLMQVFDKDEMISMRDALNTQQNGQNSQDSQRRNSVLNHMNLCIGQDIFSGSGQYNSGSYGMQQGTGNNNGGYNMNVNVSFNGPQGINLLNLLGLGTIVQISSELHRMANNMDPARVCGWLSNHLRQQLSSNQQMLMNMGEAQLFGLYKEALKSHDSGQGPIHGLLDRCINQTGNGQYGYNQNRDFSMSNNYNGGNSLNLGTPLGVAAGIGLAALAGHEMEEFVNKADKGLQSLLSNLMYHEQEQFSPQFCAKLWANLRDSVTRINNLKDVPKLLMIANPNELEFLADRLSNIPVHRDRCDSLRRCAKVLGQYRIQNNLGPIQAGLSAIGGQVGQDMYNLGQNMRSDISIGATGALAATGAMIGAAVGADYLGGQLKNGLREFGNDIRGSSIVTGADYLGDQMKNGLREFGNDIRSSSIVTGADYLGDQMKNGLREMGDDIKDSALGVGAQYLGGQIKNGFQELGNDMKGSAIVTGAEYLGGQLKNGVREMKQDINEFGNAIQNPGGWIKTEITREFSPQVQQFGNGVQQFGNSVQNAGQWVGQEAGHLGHLGNLGQAAVGVAGLAAGGALAANMVGNMMHHGQNQINGGFNGMQVGMQPGNFGLQSYQSFGQNSYGQPSSQHHGHSLGNALGALGMSAGVVAGLESMGSILGNLDLHSLINGIGKNISADIHQCKGLLSSIVNQLGGLNMITKHFVMGSIHPIEIEIAMMKQLVKIAQNGGIHQSVGSNLVNIANQCALIFENNRSRGNSSLLIGNPDAESSMSGSFNQSYGPNRNGYGHRHGHGHRGGHGRGPPTPCKLVNGACSIVKNVVGRVLDRIE